MIGISAYGVYVPLYRLKLSEIAKATGGFAPPGEKAIANFDEDAVTIATEAALNCIYSVDGMDRSGIDGLYLATTTSPFKEKQTSVTIATALDLPREITTLDSFGSLRCGTNALSSALDAVKAESAGKVMVTTSDCRMAYPESPLEQLFGDAGAAFLIGSDDVAVEVEGRFSIADEITDLWRRDEDRFVHAWEDRFNLVEGFQRVVNESIKTAAIKMNIDLTALNKIIYYAPNAKAHMGMAKSLGLNYKTQVQNPLFDTVGNVGAASPFLQLAAALDGAKPGDRILMASYGNGSDVFLLKVTDLIKKIRRENGVKKLIGSKKMISNYHKYLQLRNLVETEPTRQPEINPPATMMWREQEGILRFHCSKCNKCGNLQYPIQRICSECFNKDDFETVRLSDQRATVYLSTIDTLGYGAESSPTWAIADMPGGLRVKLQVADCNTVEEIPPGTELETTFRKFGRDGDVPVYFWKLRLSR